MANRTAELVFGLVYGVGTDASAVSNVLEDYAKQYGYTPTSFRVSEHLRSLDLDIRFDSTSPFEKMKALMDAGDEARSQSGADDILAAGAINDIFASRQRDGKGEIEPSFNVLHMVRSLKRPEEVAMLRQVYRPGFYLIGIAEDDDEQMHFLTQRKGLTSKQAEELLQRDQNDNKEHGQRTRDTFYLSDVFVELRDNRFESQLRRFLDLIFGQPFITPTRQEHAMFLAYASAARSSQLGRQVGAAIAMASGEVVSVGFNEVPSKRGGPYWEGDEDDARDHKLDKDSNSENRGMIAASILDQLKSRILDGESTKRILQVIIDQLKLPTAITDVQLTNIVSQLEKQTLVCNRDELLRLITQSDLRDITEYGRAVHAEMDAILTCVRLGISTQHKILFTTTFPCHNCTRHIIAAGISKVVYIEPYPKSKAMALHFDAISFDAANADNTAKIPFVPFVGIGPRRYLDLFSSQLTTGLSVERKTLDGKPVKWDRQSHKGPRVSMEPFSYLEREEKTLDEYKAKLLRLARKRAKRNVWKRHAYEKCTPANQLSLESCESNRSRKRYRFRLAGVETR